MEKRDYDLLLQKDKLFAYYVAEQSVKSTTMRNKHNHSHYEILYVYEGERILQVEKQDI